MEQFRKESFYGPSPLQAPWPTPREFPPKIYEHKEHKEYRKYKVTIVDIIDALKDSKIRSEVRIHLDQQYPFNS